MVSNVHSLGLEQQVILLADLVVQRLAHQVCQDCTDLDLRTSIDVSDLGVLENQVLLDVLVVAD